MKILIINDHGLYGGGTETRVRTFAEKFLEEESENEVHVLQKFPSHEWEKNKEKMNRVFFHTINNDNAYIFAKKIIKRHSIDLVQAHSLLAIKPYVLFAAKQAKIPIVWWAHDYWLLCAKRSFIDPFQASKEELCPMAEKKSCNHCMSYSAKLKHAFWKRCMGLADIAISPSKILQEIHEANNVLRGKWKVITPWVDPHFLPEQESTGEKQAKQQKKEKILLFVGSLIEFKGAWVAARALKKIVRRFPEVKLVFVGGEQEGGDRRNIETICRIDGTEKNIVFLGKKQKEEIMRLEKEAYLYLCPTVCMESFGLNWAEAMRVGCPVVVSAIGSIPEYVEHKHTGILFSPRNYDDLAAAVMELLSNPEEAERIGKNGKAYAREHFTISRAAKEMFTIYDALLKK